MKIPKFGTKNALFEYFGARISKNYRHIWNQHPRIPLTAKFREKMEIPKFETKNDLFGYFWARIFKNYCHIWNWHPRTYLLAKISGKKQKCLNLGPKMPYLGIFGLVFENNIVISEISSLKFVSKMPKFGK